MTCLLPAVVFVTLLRTCVIVDVLLVVVVVTLREYGVVDVCDNRIDARWALMDLVVNAVSLLVIKKVWIS